MTQEQRNNKALTLLFQIPKRDAYSQYLAGVIELNNKPAEALVFLNRSAVKGYAPAQAALARLYLGHNMIPRSDKKAREMLLRLVKNSQATVDQKNTAYSWLAVMSFYGIGSKVNDKQALQYMHAAQPESDLLYLQALMLSEGLGTKADLEEANKLLTQAIASGRASAANQLALNTLNGQGTDINTVKARRLFEQAASLGSVAASYNLALDSLLR